MDSFAGRNQRQGRLLYHDWIMTPSKMVTTVTVTMVIIRS